MYKNSANSTKSTKPVQKEQNSTKSTKTVQKVQKQYKKYKNSTKIVQKNSTKTALLLNNHSANSTNILQSQCKYNINAVEYIVPWQYRTKQCKQYQYCISTVQYNVNAIEYSIQYNKIQCTINMAQIIVMRYSSSDGCVSLPPTVSYTSPET